MDQPLISVIIPVYKVEEYLDRCVQSVRKQTYTNLEIILVDDGSPDNCGAMCDALAQTDGRIRVVHKENGGLSSARNAGLDIMQGEYVGFVDSDDWIEQDMIEFLYDRMCRENAQISCCGIALCDDDKVLSYMNPNLLDEETLLTKDALRELTYNQRITNSVNDKLYQRTVFDKLRFREGILYEDAQIQPFCIDGVTKVTYAARPMYCYYQAGTSILRSKFSPRRLDMIRWSEERIEFFREKYPDLVEYAMAAHCVLCTHIVYQARNCEQCHREVNQLRDVLRSNLNKRIFSLLGKRDKVRCGLLYLNKPLFYFVLNIFYSIKSK